MSPVDPTRPDAPPRTQQQPQSRCRFGIATGDITPPVGIYHRMGGAARHDRAAGVHRPLRATVVCFADVADTQRQLIVALDHCILGEAELARVKGRIDAPGAAVTVVCSHTHAAGLLSLDRIDMPGGELIPDYLDLIAVQVAALAVEAQQRAQSTTIVYGTGRCALAANRDYYDAAGERYVCGYNPAVTADDLVTVARVSDGGGGLLATVVNYACHPTTLAADNELISPDYPGAMREMVEAATAAPCLFLQGASGDLGPRDGFSGDVEVADRNGRQLGHAALAVLAGLDPPGSRFVYRGPLESGAALGIWRHEPLPEAERGRLGHWRFWRGSIDLPYRGDLAPIEEIAADLARLEQGEAVAHDAGDETAAGRHRAMAERRRRELARRRTLPPGDVFPWQVAITVSGDAVWVFVQGEPYNALQVELRRRFPRHCLVVAALAGAWSVGYLPTECSYGRDLYQQNIAVVAPGALEQGIEAIAEKISSLIDD
ncbi:MAG: neutral/alkaline non-lysosomal ceramidase N-terminal domain-containing protein [Planctomycetales bacterium]|nr:neutral/alkaline non-lysosomal ceramidase N-terminal domain-containing protein [Planctomycetales bacterium]